MRAWLEQIDPLQLAEWMAYEQLEPWNAGDDAGGEDRGRGSRPDAMEAAIRAAFGFNT